MLSALNSALRIIRLALPKIGVGWMFALLTVDFNRIAVVEFGVAAVLITSMLAMHYFLSPFQVVIGRITDRFPVFGMRRTPYLLAASIVASLIFPLLPSVLLSMSDGSTLALVGCFALFATFGVSIAIIGDAHHALIVECTTERYRSAVISVVWTLTILSTIMAAVVMNIVRPEFSQEAMQQLYNLTPFVVITSALLGVVGMEKKLRGEALHDAIELARVAAPAGNPLAAAARILRDNPQTRGFFAFIFVSIFAIFLQDNILEIFGAEVFQMTVQETTRFQPTWGGGVLLGMVLMGIATLLVPITKKRIALIGCYGTAAGFLALAVASAAELDGLLMPALFTMGFFTGFFNVGGLAMMMDMTVEGATGLYMGLWGVAQAFGTGLSSMGSGALHSALIETHLMHPASAYTLIFGAEAAAMVGAALILRHLSTEQFRKLHHERLSRADLARGMEAGSAA